jgi:uracil-DNA glycosylase family 4
MERVETLPLGEVARWYFTLAHRWPEVFNDHQLAEYWSWSRTAAGTDHQAFVGCLRAAALKLLRTSVSACKACPLSQYRMAGRPVLDDCSYHNDPFHNYNVNSPHMPVGATQAEIMMVAEGPGQFEQRTGNPFVTYQILAGSTCAYQCGEYEKCYNPQSQVPQQPCKPTPLSKLVSYDELVATRKQRAATPPFPLKTVAGFLDNALKAAGLWREGWNTRQELLEADSEKGRPRPGSIYLTNVVKCRSCQPRASGKGFEDLSPSKENMDACAPYLEMQIHIVQPKVIVAMGNPAVIGLIGIADPKVLSLRGNAYPSKWQIPVLVEVHPSYISRQSPSDQTELLAAFVQTLEKAKQIVDGSLVVPWMLKRSLVIEETDYPSPDEMEFTSTFDNAQ